MCRQTVSDYLLDTCNPLQIKNSTWFQICSCYQAINDKNCFDRCPASVTGKSVLDGSVNPLIAALCNPLSINPLAPPPQKQPWDTFNPVVTSKLPSSTSSNQGPTSVTVKSDGLVPEVNSVFSGLFGILLAML